MAKVQIGSGKSASFILQLKREQIKGFELTGEAPKYVKGSAPVKGKKKSKKDKLREEAALRDSDSV